MSYLNFLLPFPICITEQLSTLKSICQSLTHSYNLRRSSLIMNSSSSVTTSLHSFVSSANFDIFFRVYAFIDIIDEDYKKEWPIPAAPHLSHQSIPKMPLCFQPSLFYPSANSPS